MIRAPEWCIKGGSSRTPRLLPSSSFLIALLNCHRNHHFVLLPVQTLSRWLVVHPFLLEHLAIHTSLTLPTTTFFPQPQSSPYLVTSKPSFPSTSSISPQSPCLLHKPCITLPLLRCRSPCRGNRHTMLLQLRAYHTVAHHFRHRVPVRASTRPPYRP